MKRLTLALALAVFGCSDNNNNNNAMDMSISGSTIAQARAGFTPPMQSVTVNNVVVVSPVIQASDNHYWEAYVEDAAGGMSSGVLVYCNHTAMKNTCPASISAPSQGDSLTIAGTLGPVFNGVLELYPSMVMAMGKGTAPAALTVKATDLSPANPTKGALGVFVTLSGTFTVSDVMNTDLFDNRWGPKGSCGGAGDGGGCEPCKPPMWDGFVVTDGTNKIYVYNNMFFKTEHWQSSPECLTQTGAVPVKVGDKFSKLSGIADIGPYTPAMSAVLYPTVDGDLAH